VAGAAGPKPDPVTGHRSPVTSVRRRVAITGIGLVTPLGNDAPTTWRALLDGRSGVAPITGFDASGFPVRIAAEVKDFDALARLKDAKLLKLANRAHRFGLAAADEAIADAGVRPDEATATRWACVAGAGMLGWDFDDLASFQREFADDGELHEDRLFAAGPAATDPIAFCRAQPNAGMALLTRRFDIRGYASTVHTACASGGQAIGTAMRLVRRGIADRALCGGFDSMLHPLGLAGFCLLQALSPDNDQPERASRPFDRTRNGFVLGEGAGFLVLEDWDLARRRGARIYAELAGDGNSLSSYRITDSHPSGDGPIQAMRQALGDAGIAPEEVDYVNAHGTSTPMNDRGECAAVRAVFGTHADRVAVSSTKSLMGHLIAAAGAVEAAVSALSIQEGVLPVSANLEERDPECDLDFVVGQARHRPVRSALSNSFGFGGSNSCLVLRRADGAEA
jgi:beta-ketoacyl-acyl-carrier-protein synthase II